MLHLHDHKPYVPSTTNTRLDCLIERVKAIDFERLSHLERKGEGLGTPGRVRWSMTRKAMLLRLIAVGEVAIIDAMLDHELSIEELSRWVDSLEAGGVRALTITDQLRKRGVKRHDQLHVGA